MLGLNILLEQEISLILPDKRIIKIKYKPQRYRHLEGIRIEIEAPKDIKIIKPKKEI